MVYLTGAAAIVDFQKGLLAIDDPNNFNVTLDVVVLHIFFDGQDKPFRESIQIGI